MGAAGWRAGIAAARGAGLATDRRLVFTRAVVRRLVVMGCEGSLCERARDPRDTVPATRATANYARSALLATTRSTSEVIAAPSPGLVRSRSSGVIDAAPSSYASVSVPASRS